MSASSPSASAPPSKGQVFVKRLISTVGLWGFVTVAIIVAKAPMFFILLGVLGILSAVEYGRMDRTLPKPWKLGLPAITALWFAVTFTLSLQNGGPWHPLVDLGFFAAVTFAAFLPALFRPLEGRATLWAIVYSIAGFVYVPWLSSFMTRVIFLPGMREDGTLPGVPYLIFLVAATKFTDIGAYVVGSLIGKHKMIPHVSPGKTWEGMIGALLGALGAGMAVYFLCREQMTLLTPGSAAVLCLVMSMVCVVGDLAESIVKRCLGAKDSGSFLPGIGGALDLIDSLLFTGPLFYLYLVYVS